MSTCSPGINTFARKTAGQKIDWSLTDVLLGVTLLWAVIPETLTGDVYFYDIPLRFCFFFAAVISCAFSTVLLGVSNVTFQLKVAILALLGMAAFGLIRGNDLKFWVIDTSNWTALIFGLYWGGRYSRQYTINILYGWSWAVTCVLLLNILGLLSGLIPQAGEGDRLYSYSLFTSTAFVTSLFPLWLTLDSRTAGLVLPRRSRLLAITGISCVLFCSMLSATRSMFLTGSVALMIVLWIRLHGKNAVLWVGVALAGSLLAAAFLFNADVGSGEGVTNRLSSTNLAEEYRYIELQLLFEDLEGHWLTGKGFGSRFESCIGKHGNFLAFAPHIGIFTSLFKGGAVVFGMLFLVPLATAAFQMVRLHKSSLSLACSAAVLLYCTQASMSGGWNFIALFLLGAMFTLSSRSTLQKLPSSISSGREKKCAS